MDMKEMSVAELLVSAFADNGVKRIFGVPGGGSSLDIIQAAADRGIDFVLTRTENAAVMMAAATAELSGTVGVALMTKGPGVANAVNGVAYASLDRAPVVVVTDGFSSEQQVYVTHQVFDQEALLKPLTKAFRRLEKDCSATEIRSLIEMAMTPPFGPVQIELTAGVAKSKLSTSDIDLVATRASSVIDEPAFTDIGERLSKAARPVVIVGLGAREASTSTIVKGFIEALNCPALSTYKAKGVVPDSHPQYIGIFTGGAAEEECVAQADLIVLCGVDPVEFVLQPWRYDAPVIEIALDRHDVHYTPIAAGLYGSISEHLAKLLPDCRASDWLDEEMTGLRDRMHDRLQYPAVSGLGPQVIVEMAMDAARDVGQEPRITVDAGAHMFSAMAFSRCEKPCDVLISNGLATMAFALPAAIAAALHEPERPVIAFTGDGGLLMCLGELLTAVQQQTRIIVIVFNDESLSLIDIKQQQRKLPTLGVRWGRPDFAQTMTALGGSAFLIDKVSDYKHALAAAMNERGPVLIDVIIDPSGYPEQLKALRG
jgi:acetolactate synthase-1/2/3 large subunit